MEESCGKTWKHFWLPCQGSGADDSIKFDWLIPGKELVVFPFADVCYVPPLSEVWFRPKLDGECSRTVIDTISNLIWYQSSLEIAVLPTLTLLSWMASTRAAD